MAFDTFQKELAKLNPRQREAVEAIEGPVMVIAGPGTGKTQILTLRIANILHKTDTPADCILALTFTESAAANMRRRLVSLIGSRGYYVHIHTFHGFCNRLIQQYPDTFPAIIGARAAMPADTMAILRDSIERGPWTDLRPVNAVFYYIPEILKAIKNIKREGFSPETFAGLVAKEQEALATRLDARHASGRFAGELKSDYRKKLQKLKRSEDLAGIYAEYQAVLRARKLYDFDDMILETVRAMELNSDFLLELQEQYQYMLVDEHQDTNGAQNKVLELLASYFPNPNLFVVGDEKQAIFRFQGASLDNFLYFKNTFKNVVLINLEENYRSTQAILDSAQSLIEKNNAVLPGKLRAAHAHIGKENPIEVWNFPVPQAELLFLAERIKALAASNVPWGDIAVLYRENRDAIPIADFFAAQGIPFAVESDTNLLANRLIVKLRALLRAVNLFGEEEALARILHIDFLGIDPLDIYRLLHAAGADSAANLYDRISDPALCADLGLRIPENVRNLYKNLVRWKRYSENEELAKFVARIMRESGFMTHVLQSGAYTERMESVSAFFDEVKRMSENHPQCKLRDFMDYLDVLESHGATIKEQRTKFQHAVHCMTAHRAKGLEFSAVFITGAYDGHWGNKRAYTYFALPFKTASEISEFEKNEDERRLFYMALTRAKRMACITYCQVSSDGREQVPSQFIGEILEELRDMRSGEEFEKKFAKQREMFIAVPAEKPAVTEKEYMAEIFRKRGLSATALNNYISCPWKYVYQNLLRIPQVPSPAQRYGIAMHKALQVFFDGKKSGKKADKDVLLRAFERSLERQPLGVRDGALLSKKGTDALGGYFDTWHTTWNIDTINEFKISGVVFGDDIKLTGNLDKLEVDDAGKTAVVVDYKTKQPQSRNWIEGKTKDAQSGDYKRQLVFYKLLLNLKPEKTYIMRAGVIDFLEPNERGIYKREPFEVSDAEVKELGEVIARVADEIINARFWNRRCNDGACEFCALRNLMGWAAP